MCGITGYIARAKRPDPSVIDRMTDTLAHRGPDDRGTLTEDKESYALALGQRRLSIIDLSSAGRQPLEAFGYAITFNGEVYNYQELRKELEGLGYVFATATDTEVVVAAYDRWGPACIDRFIGMFAFALWDRRRERLSLYRDRAGVKPLYYRMDESGLVFGSELKALLEYPDLERRQDLAAVAAYFRYGYIPAPLSIWEGVKKLEPGCRLAYDARTGEGRTERYWDVLEHYAKPKLAIGIEEAEAELVRLMDSAFSYRMVSDVPVGVFLSGGYDSSTVAAFLAAKGGARLKTFTIGFEDDAYDESRYARLVASHLGTEHVERVCGREEVAAILPRLPKIFDEPFADPSSIPTVLVSQVARRDVTVALSADAGDETFAGYDKYPLAMEYLRRFGRLPCPLAAAGAGLLGAIDPARLPGASSSYNFPTKYGKTIELLRARSAAETLEVVSRCRSPREERALLGAETASATAPIAFMDRAFSDPSLDPLSQMLALDYRTYLPDDVLVKVDRAAMSVSLEGRDPLLDHRIIEFAARLPADMKLHGRAGKVILKRIAHTKLPKELLDRPKRGFAAPIERWLKEDLKDLTRKYFDRERLARGGVVNPDAAVPLARAFLEDKPVSAKQLWTILMYEMWREEWAS